MKYIRQDGNAITNLTWTAPTENTDGSPIDYELAYNLYIDGVQALAFPGTLNPDGRYSFAAADVPQLQEPGTYELTLTAFNTNVPDIESDPSNALTLTVVAVPLAPTAFSAE